MANFSENQVRHVYFAKTSSATKIDSTASVGTLAYLALKDKDKTASSICLQYMGYGGLTRSDIIDGNKIVSITSTDAAKMYHNVSSRKLELKSSVYTGTAMDKKTFGKDFILRLDFKQFVGMSDEDSYIKEAAVRCYDGMTTSVFYQTLAIQLAKNFSREITPLVDIYLNTTKVTPDTEIDEDDETYSYITIKEVRQPWNLGTMRETFVDFTVIPGTIDVDGAEIEMMKVTNTTSSSEQFDNSRSAADLEYFAMGERGDVYRNVGWPNTINSKTVLDGTTPCDAVDIVYFYSGNVEDIQKSRKAITILTPVGDGATLAGNIKKLLTATAASQIGEIQGE